MSGKSGHSKSGKGKGGGGQRNTDQSVHSPAVTRSHGTPSTNKGVQGKVSSSSKESTTPLGRKLAAQEKADKTKADAAAAASGSQQSSNASGADATTSNSASPQESHQNPNAGAAPPGAASTPTAAGGSSGGNGGQPGASPAQNAAPSGPTRGMDGDDAENIHDEYVDESSSKYLIRGSYRSRDDDLSSPPAKWTELLHSLAAMRSHVDAMDKNELPSGHGWEAHTTDTRHGSYFISTNWMMPSLRRDEIVQLFRDMGDCLMEVATADDQKYIVEAHELAMTCTTVTSTIAIEARTAQNEYNLGSQRTDDDEVPNMMWEDTPNGHYYLDMADCIVSMMIALDIAGELQANYDSSHPDFNNSKDDEQEAKEDNRPLDFLGSQMRDNNRAPRRLPPLRSGDGGGGGGGDDEPDDDGDGGGGGRNNGFPRPGRRNERSRKSDTVQRSPPAWFDSLDKNQLLKIIDAAKNDITNPKNTVTSQEIVSIVKTLIKGNFKATDSFISEWSKAMTKIALGDKLKPPLSMELLVGVQPFAAAFAKTFKFSKTFEFLIKHSYVEPASTNNSGGTETVSNYFRQASTSVNHHVNGTHQGTLLQSQSPQTSAFDVTEKRLSAFYAQVNELSSELEQRGFSLGELPSTWEILDDTENAEIAFDFMIEYHQKTQSRLIKFMHDLMVELTKKNKSSTFQKILNEAESSVNAIHVTDKPSVVPRASYHEFLDIMLMRDQTGLYLVQEFLYDLATPDMGNVANATTAFLESPTLVNPGWSLLDLEIFLTDKIKTYQEHLPHNGDEGVQYLESVVIVACVEKSISYSGSRWPKGAELSSFVREATFERNRPACREELGRHYKILVNHLAEQAITHDYPADPKAKNSWKPPTKTKSRKGSNRDNANVNATIAADKVKEIKDMQEKVKNAVNDSTKLQNAIDKAIERRKQNSNKAFSFAKGKLLNNNFKTVFEPLFEAMTETDKPRKKLKIAEAMEVPKATIASMNADQLLAFMILNPSFGTPGNVGGKILQTKGDDGAADDDGANDGTNAEIKAMLATTLERMDTLQARIDSAETPNSSTTNGPADQAQADDEIRTELQELRDKITAMEAQM